MDPEYGKRYVYFRADKHNENIVPYHPMVLLLWNAHMNVQVTPGPALCNLPARVVHLL